MELIARKIRMCTRQLPNLNSPRFLVHGYLISMQAGFLRDASVVDTERYAFALSGLVSWLAALAGRASRQLGRLARLALLGR